MAKCSRIQLRYNIPYSNFSNNLIVSESSNFRPIALVLQQALHEKILPALTGAALGSPAERAALGRGGEILPPPPANSRTSDRSEAGEAAIESSQRLLSEVFFLNILKKVTNQVKVRSKVKTVTFCLIGY